MPLPPLPPEEIRVEGFLATNGQRIAFSRPGVTKDEEATARAFFLSYALSITADLTRRIPELYPFVPDTVRFTNTVFSPPPPEWMDVWWRMRRDYIAAVETLRGSHAAGN